MSRSTVSKSRADKSKGGTNAPTPAISHDIVPGKFTDHDWSLMVDRDEGDDFIEDIVGEVCSSAMKIIYDNYIQKQLLPYTVSQARDALIQIIEWQFLSRDEGEKSMEADTAWTEDEEPDPAMTDCWAQGSVPKQLLKAATPNTPAGSLVEDLEEAGQLEEADRDAVDGEETASRNEESAGEAGVEVDSTINQEVDVSLPPDTTETSRDKSGNSETRSNSKRRQKFKPYQGRISSAGIKNLTESLEKTESKLFEEEYARQVMESYVDQDIDPSILQMPLSCHSILKMAVQLKHDNISLLLTALHQEASTLNGSQLQGGRPPGHHDVLYDDRGNVVSVIKLDPEKLPSHRVRTGFHIVNPEVEAAQARLEAMRTGRYMPVNNKKKKGKSESNSRGTSLGSTRATTDSSGTSHNRAGQKHSINNNSSKDAITPLPPPLIESMELSPGVVVREGNRIKKGPKQHPRKTELITSATQRSLQPVVASPTRPKVSVTDILEPYGPILRPLRDSPPIPPIVPHPPPLST